MALTNYRRRLGVAVVGCGLVGRRRALAAAEHPSSRLTVVVDRDPERAHALAEETGAQPFTDWRAAIGRRDVQVVVVCTPNAFLSEIGCGALEAGRHVLIEKPMGRSLAEARRLAIAAYRSGRILKLGFNHRYHPAIAALIERVREGEVGRVVNVRARYGHGGRPGYETEWRGNPGLAGGGHLTDQGVHLLDLIHAVLGMPARAVAFLDTAVWQLKPLEDNAYAMLRFRTGAVALLHTGLTQWKNLFSLEAHGETGALSVEGLGGSYGPQRLISVRRSLEGGAPEVEETVFPDEDRSWNLEWDDFMAAVANGHAPLHGTVGDGLAVMCMLQALYTSARSGSVVELCVPDAAAAEDRARRGMLRVATR